MIIDSQTNKVFFSEILLSKYSDIAINLKSILDKHAVAYTFLKGTKDIWCRDFMPIQVTKNKFVQFRYEPSYLVGYEKLQSDPNEICETINIKTIKSDLNIDGGNIIKWTDKVILTDRIYQENKKMTESQIIKELKDKLEAEIIIITQINTDFTGHADGMVRFVNNDTLLINSLKNEYEYIKDNILKIIKTYGLNYIELPIFEFKNKNFKESAIGIYINFLELENLIIFPIFQTFNNKDEEAVKIIKYVYPNKTIELINVNNIAREGGVMNCISWNIRQ